MAKRTDEIKNTFQASMIRLQDLFEDFDALLTKDFLPADLIQVYENIQEENLVFKGLHNKYAQSLICRTETETSKTELQEIRSIREKFRISITMTSERYNQALKGKEHDREPPSEDRQSFETKMKEIEKTAGATAAAAAAEVVKALTPKYEGRCELERLPCPSWDGKRTTYATFKKHFLESMVQNHQDDSKQLIRLRSAIKDPGARWKRKVETCSDITRAWTLLDREFQNNQKLITEIYNNLDKFRLKPNSSESLSEFSSIIRELIQQFEDIGKPQETQCEVFVDKLRKKMDRETLEIFRYYVNLKNQEETSEILADWLDFMATIRIDTGGNNWVKMSSNIYSGHKYSNKPSRSSSNYAIRTTENCPIECPEKHQLLTCPKFKLMTIHDRWRIVRKQKRCRKCFSTHHTDKCEQANNCDKCAEQHNTLLHIDGYYKGGLNPNARPFSNDTKTANGANQSLMVQDRRINCVSAQCPVQMILVNDAQNNKKKAIIFQDSGSDICLMRKEYAMKLGLRGKEITLNMLLAGGERRVELSEILTVTVSPFDDTAAEKTFNVYVVNKPCSDAKTVSKKSLEKYSHLQPLIDKLYLDGGKIDILIGTEFSDAFIDLASKVGESGQPIAKKNIFGWYILGSVDDKTEFKSCNFVKSAVIENFNSAQTNHDIKQLLCQDQIGIKPTKYCVCSEDVLKENRFIKLLSESTKLIDGRIQVRMPWVSKGPPLYSNYDLAYKRMESTERSLIKKDKLEVVNAEVNKLVDSGFVKILNQGEVNHSKPEFYLPMQAVFTPGRSTEVRLVFDSSAKGHDGLSLNERLEKGPNLINSLLEVLIAWRWDNVAYSGDIQKMFNQVLVHPDDQVFHRFLWRPSPSEQPKIYQWIRLSFGDKPAPSIASNAINVLAKMSETKYPEAAKELLNRTYVDDIAGSKATQDEAKNTIENIDSILDQGHFKIKCWYSNNGLIDQDTSKEVVTTILGHKWNKQTDTFSYKKDSISEVKGIFNKRKCLASLAQVWDPIGLVSAVTIKFRIDMQNLWAIGYNWDQSLPEDLQTKWLNNIQLMNEILQTTFERKLKPENATDKPEVHGFCDGGEMAFGGIVFLRWTLNNNEYVCVPVLTKALVAPLKKKSIPRLEMLGCLLLTRMYESLIKALTFAGAKDFPVFLWCDSTTALKWLKSPPQKFRPFVSARVAEIQETIDVQYFRYIPSELNQADALTRGIQVNQLSRWLEGPDFLKLNESEWPNFEIKLSTHEDESEQTLAEYKTIKGSTHAIQNNNTTDVMDKLLNSVSSFIKLRRYLCHLIRFAKYIAKRDFNKGSITVSELKHSQNVLYKWTQMNLQNPSQKLGFTLLPDDNGIIRAHGRLENIRTLPTDQRNPIILPKDHKFVKLLLIHLHEKRGHCGYKSLIAEARKHFWIFGLRNTANSLTRNCITCRKLRRKPEKQLMGQLPELRVAAGFPAFYNTALDMFGPVHIKLGRKTLKEAQVIIFACMTSRAIHLELVTDKSSDTFLMAYRRFSCIRGQAKCLWSDQGTNFIGSQTYLKEIMKDWDINKIKNVITQKYGCNLQFQWDWNIPHASHMNGVVESLIHSVRQALNATCKMREYTEEQWNTILAETTYLINSRPLYPASNEIFEDPPITPNDLLFGPNITPPQPEDKNHINPRNLNRSAQSRVAEFWHCWLKYFAPTLIPRNKWYRSRDNLKIGDLVLEIDPNQKRGLWKMAVIHKVYPGSDGKVRKVQIKTASGLYDRPIHKLCLIATKEELTPCV